jgi:hypothetical protein
MNESLATKPAILIDLKKHRIRIHKNTLHLLGKPEYICILVNPADQMIAVSCAVKSDHLAHYINWKALANQKSYELYSMNLIESLREVCTDLQDNRSYRIYGEIVPIAGVAQFRMNDSILINNGVNIKSGTYHE